MASRLVPPDVVARLAVSPEPAARWIALALLAGRPPTDAAVVGAHRDVVADPLTEDLLARLGTWEDPPPISGHDKPAFVPDARRIVAIDGSTIEGSFPAYQSGNSFEASSQF